jgi:hypothetical protein
MPREARVIQIDEPSFPLPVAAEEEDLRATEAQQFDRLAGVVRRIYIILRSEAEGHEYNPGPKWDGGQDRHGRNHQPIWPRLSKFFVEHGIEPMGYMKAQFWQASSGRKPLPNAMMSAAAQATYDRYRKQIEGDIARRLRWEIGSVRSEMLPIQEGLGWTYIRALRWALNNERTVKASPLVRYCLAVEYGLDDIAGLFHDYALFQYAFQKNAYDAAWPEGTIPGGLQQEAQNLVQRVLT